VIEPDRKNGMIIAERSNAELFGRVFSISMAVASVFYCNYAYPDEITWWNWILILIIVFAVVEYILQMTLQPLAEKIHDRSEKKKYYFRSGMATCKERYNKSEKDELTEKQKEEPVLFIAKEKDKAEQYYYRFEDRTWVSTDEMDVKAVKTEIKTYLKMKNI
jgi:uncharacterized membrane protein